MSMINKHRPKSIKQLVGNEALKKSLESLLSRKKEDMPTSYLFSGASGCGKTTLAKIIANSLGITDKDLGYYNAANTRGIDTIRAIIEASQYSSLTGGAKMFILDECFASGTDIHTPSGIRKIEDIVSGEIVFNIDSKVKVKQVFKNKVDLNRVIKLNFSNGKNTICSEDHLYLTNDGWIKAKNLKNMMLLTSDCDTVYETLLQKGDKNHVQSYLPTMSQRVCNKKENTTVLLQSLFSFMEKCTFPGVSSYLFNLWGESCYKGPKYKDLQFLQNPKSNMQRVWKRIYSQVTQCCSMLANLCWEMEKQTTRFQREGLHQRNSNKMFSGFSKVHTFLRRTFSIVNKNERKQSFSDARSYRKRERNKTIEWVTSYLDRCTWGQWSIYGIPSFACNSIGMGNGSSCRISEITKRIPNKLQSRCGASKIKDCNRSGWEQPQIEKSYIKRFEENRETSRVRVESVEIYQPGNNDESFISVIGNKERDQGFVEFYDLEIDGHPSYFANGHAVHNCHKLTSDAQESLLTSLEKPPSNVFFALCTTEPEKLKTTLKNRCQQFEVKPLSNSEMGLLLKRVTGREKKEVSAKVISNIIQVAEGSARHALSLLDSIIDMQDEAQALLAIESSTTSETQVIEICRLLVSDSSEKSKVSTMCKLLKGFSGEAEPARRAILGYFYSCLIKDGNPRMASIGEWFEDNFYDSGKFGLGKACIGACRE